MADPHDPQPVRVAVIYEPEAAKPRPVWFELRGEQIKIGEVCYFWRSWNGEAEILSYSVSTAQGQFELSFNSKTHAWTAADKSADTL